MSEKATLDEFGQTEKEVTEKQSVEVVGIGELQQLEESPIKSWDLSKLGEILSLEYGDNLPSNSRQVGDIPVYGSNGQVDTHSEAAVDSPGIVLGRKGSIGKFEFSESPFWPIDTTYYITSEETSQNLRFLYYLLQNLQLERLNAASAIPGLNRNDAYGLNALVPHPEEQRKIATVLHNVDQAIQKTEEIVDQAEKVKKGVIQENILNKISKSSSPTALGNIPNNWDKVKLEDAASKQEGSFVDGPFGSSLKAEEFVEDGFARILQLQNVKEGWYCDSNIRYITEEIYTELERHSAEPGDLFIAKMASPVARSCILPSKYDHYMLGCADVVKLTPNEEFVDEFIMYCLNSYPVWKQAAAHIRGSGRLRVNLNQLKKVELPKPPRDDQEKIVTAVNGISNFIDSHKKEKQQFQRLKKSLMQDLLSGKVRTTDTSIAVPDEIRQHG